MLVIVRDEEKVDGDETRHPWGGGKEISETLRGEDEGCRNKKYGEA